MDEQIYDDLDTAEMSMKSNEYSLIFIQNGEVMNAWTGHPIPSLLVQIDNNTIQLNDTTVGLDFLGKAGALLLAHMHVKAVYTQKATKTALAIMIRAGIVCQTQQMIPNLSYDSPLFDQYERLVMSIDDPQQAFEQLLHIQ